MPAPFANHTTGHELDEPMIPPHFFACALVAHHLGDCFDTLGNRLFFSNAVIEGGPYGDSRLLLARARFISGPPTGSDHGPHNEMTAHSASEEGRPGVASSFDRRMTGRAYDPGSIATEPEPGSLGDPKAFVVSPKWDKRIERVMALVAVFILGWLAGILQASTWTARPF